MADGKLWPGQNDEAVFRNSKMQSVGKMAQTRARDLKTRGDGEGEGGKGIVQQCTMADVVVVDVRKSLAYHL
jgi:hypothetical protein